MTVYFILFIAAAVGIPLCKAASENNKPARVRISAYCILICIALTVVSAIRLSVGHDYNLYASIFYDLNFMDDEQLWDMRREKGFMLILRLINTVTADYTVCFAVLSLLIYPPLVNYIFRYSENCGVSITAFLAFGVFFNSLNFMPQFMAAIICAYAFKYAEKGCISRFIVFVLLACAFHRSAVIILPCLFFAYIPWNRITFAVTTVSAAGLFVFSRRILEFVTKYVYTYYELESNPEIANGLSPYYTVMFGILFITAYLMRDKIQWDEREKSILLWCSFAAFFFELIGIQFAVISRFSVLFFIPCTALLVPKLFTAVCKAVEGKKGSRLKIAVGIALCVLMAGNYTALLSKNYNGVVPYQTVFSQNGGSQYE